MQNFQSLGATREGGRADGSTLTLPIGLSIRKFRLGHRPRRVRAGETRRVAASSRPVPKFPGRRGEAFIFLNEEESSIPGELYLPWREQENWSEFGSDSAVQEE